MSSFDECIVPFKAPPAPSQIPVYYASSLAKRCMMIFQTYINMMNDRIRRQHAYENPFHFKWIKSLDSLEYFEVRIRPDTCR